MKKAMFDFREHLALVDLLMTGPAVAAAHELEGHYTAELVPYFEAIDVRADGQHESVVRARALMVAFQDAARPGFGNSLLTLPQRVCDWLLCRRRK